MARLEIQVKFTERDVERFWNKVRVGRLEQCWPFTGACRPPKDLGYGCFRLKDACHHAHRMALASTGVQVVGKVVRHRCHNGPCCNPSHLATGDHYDNVADRVASGRSAKGEVNGRSKLTEEEVICMRQDTRTHYYYAKKYGCNVTTISLARRGVTWSYLNAQYEPIKKTQGY